MLARNTEESHRTSTPIELLFDLCFVVTVSQAARELNGSLTQNHFGSGIVGYLVVALEGTRQGSTVSPMTAGGAVAEAVSVYLLLTGIVLSRLRPASVLKMRFIALFSVLLLIVGFSARALSIGLVLPIMGSSWWPSSCWTNRLRGSIRRPEWLPRPGGLAQPGEANRPAAVEGCFARLNLLDAC